MSKGVRLSRWRIFLCAVGWGHHDGPMYGLEHCKYCGKEKRAGI